MVRHRYQFTIEITCHEWFDTDSDRSIEEQIEFYMGPDAKYPGGSIGEIERLTPGPDEDWGHEGPLVESDYYDGSEGIKCEACGALAKEETPEDLRNYDCERQSEGGGRS